MVQIRTLKETKPKSPGVCQGSADLHGVHVVRGGVLGQAGQGALHRLQPGGHLRGQVLQPLPLEAEVGEGVLGLVVDLVGVGHLLPEVRLQDLGGGEHRGDVGLDQRFLKGAPRTPFLGP